MCKCLAKAKLKGMFAPVSESVGIYYLNSQAGGRKIGSKEVEGDLNFICGI